VKNLLIRGWFYILITISSLAVFSILVYKYSEGERNTYNSNVSYISSISYNPNSEFIAIDPVKDGLNRLKVEQRQKIAEKERQEKIDRIEALFARYNSPMQEYAELVFRRVEDCGSGTADYRILVAIAGNESGFGRVPYKLYNPYGYLDGKQYADWNDSLTFLSCVITQRFIVPCENDLTCIINKYAGPSDDKSQWIRNVTYFINQL
jgi:hypothetical protein